ncbi:unnamed protein product [Phytophthora fragariaefolia]|uniref:Unnamed protein product n=1 Tax=Phytophthora fragariaefolia TaxID=1490495 RepID=A0A9W7D3E3_9STRA|nr:unnamed protein product [Phytophthora fragariaefolia]
MLSDIAEGDSPPSTIRVERALDEEAKDEVVLNDSYQEVPEELQIDTYDSDRFMIALSRCVWFDDPNDDDPNLCEEDPDSDDLDLEIEEIIVAINNEFDEGNDAF